MDDNIKLSFSFYLIVCIHIFLSIELPCLIKYHIVICNMYLVYSLWLVWCFISLFIVFALPEFACRERRFLASSISDCDQSYHCSTLMIVTFNLFHRKRVAWMFFSDPFFLLDKILCFIDCSCRWCSVQVHIYFFNVNIHAYIAWKINVLIIEKRWCLVKCIHIHTHAFEVQRFII